MNIYIMRHGEAVPTHQARTDRERPLTENGRLQAMYMAQWLKAHYSVPSCILSSPFVRTTETAAIVAAQLEVKKPILYSDDLISGSAPEAAAGAILAQCAGDVLVVSHMPLVAQLTLWFAPGAVIERFPPATVACIDYDRQSAHGILLAQVSPSEVMPS
ncbi:MAG: phosphohistidine phosphatase SixA [Gammaproteobacteria bacterium]|nr:MAG: phosphohistidine phosphatase SixA [Gammaproteobacteria bacterium]